MRNRSRRIAWLATTAVAAALLCSSSVSASEGGLVLVPDWERTLPALILFFALLTVPVNLLIFRPIFRVLDARAEKIAGTRRRAEKLARDADETLAHYEQSVREVRNEAERDRKQRHQAARHAHASQTAEARAEAEREVLRAREEVDAALRDARASLQAQAQGLAAEAAARVLGRALS